MINSIRHFLLISLFITITIASSITAIGNYLLNSKVLYPILDDQLYKTYSIIKLALANRSSHIKAIANKNFNLYLNKITISESKQIIFAVITPDNKIIFHSKNRFQLPKRFQIGFNDIKIAGSGWRIYVNYDADKKNKIIVTEPFEARDKFVDNIARNNIYILLFTYPIFGLLAWLIVNLALRCITRVTNEIANRAPNWLEPIPNKNTPIEIQPLISALNQLLIRVKLAFERSKRFSGDAAHELRTPLAAIQTQAQVALRATDPKEKQLALEKVMQGVKRTSHIINQLLTLSRLGHEEELNDTRVLDLHKLTTETVASLIPLARNKNITVSLLPRPENCNIIGNNIALDILIRNIIDNAIRYTPNDGKIFISILTDKNRVIFQAIDSGPGIPTELQGDVFNRFYRVIGSKAQGSGLGLAIVQQIAKLHRAEISLKSPKQGGLQFNVSFPKSFKI